jgi:ATP-binding cassette, subfamily B, bacterial MsbA
MRSKSNSAIKDELRSSEQLKRLFGFVSPYRVRLILALFFITTGSLLGLAGPYTLQFLVDAVFVEGSFLLLNRIALILIAIFLTQSIFYFIRGYLLSYIGERVMADLRLHLFQHLQTLSISFYNERRTGELVSRLTNDVATVRSVVTSDISTAISQFLTFIGAFILIIITNWRLTLFMFALVPLVMLFAIIYGRRLRSLSRSVQDQLANATTVLEESIAGVRIVQSFSREPYEMSRFRESIERTFVLAMRRIRLSASFGPIISFLGFSVVVSIFWYGGIQVLTGELTAGQLVMFLILTMTIAGSIGQFSGLYTSLQEALGATRRLFEILDTQPEIRDIPEAVSLPTITGTIQFKNVSFSYKDNPGIHILKEINLDIKPGEVMALVGPSGAGKTTLFNLIARFYDPTSGKVCVDGFDLRTIQLKSLRDQTGIVPQETLLFGGSVRENILYGRLEATQEEMIEAASASNAHDFIVHLPNGYDTIVGERGVKLSGGQRQRIAIARAILKDPRILLLDEATSSLDSESEGLVQEALHRLMEGRTSIVIAHRLSTIRSADRIAVLDEGKLVELGAHDELMLLDGLYARLYRSQFKEEFMYTGKAADLDLSVTDEQEDADKSARKRRTFGFLTGIGSE